MSTRAQLSVIAEAPAKLNLTLAVVGRRADGYHDVVSWVQQVEWFDRVLVRPWERLALRVRGNAAAVPADESNLACRAARRLAAEAGRSPDVLIELEKSIPAGAGLGGGSSDAAAVLRALIDLWELGKTAAAWTPLAAEIGSDVPLFMERGAAVVRGRGERTERPANAWHGWTAIVSPDLHVSTAEVYRRVRVDPDRPRPAEVWNDPPADGLALMRRLYNDLEPAAFALEPRLGELHRRLDGFEGRPVRMTGSGSALFSLFNERDDAEQWSERVRIQLPDGAAVRVARLLE